MTKKAILVGVVVLLALAVFILNKQAANAPAKTSPTPTHLGSRPQDASSLCTGDMTNIVVQSVVQTGRELIVTGRARVFENTLRVELEDAQGNSLHQQTIMADAIDTGQFGPFLDQIQLPPGKTGKMNLFVLNFSAKDGAPENVNDCKIEVK